ncbi:GNAT family N-acetyltransferase [Lentibacillus amyloliquefaciens]|nr:GNAT family N-acetyltransferase [Lentibacillus amyloliquefaciens]
MMMIDIRLLEADDAATYKNLRLEALLNSPAAFPASYDEVQADATEKYKVRFQSENIHTFGAFEADDLVGVVTLEQETKKKTAHRTIIWGLYVTPYNRESGTGKKLMHTAIDYAKSLEGVEQIFLSVIIKRTTSESLFYAMGFVPLGRHRRAVKLGGKYYDEEYMIMRIS